MKTLYLDLGMGAAGDMLTAALLELLPADSRKGFIDRLNGLGIPGVEFNAETVSKCGINGTHMAVLVNGAEEGAAVHSHVDNHKHEHTHSHVHNHGHVDNHEHGHTHSHVDNHEHAHSHGHDHSSMAAIEHLVRGHMNISEKVQDDVMAVYGLIAEAESAAHGVPVDQIHFHEVGSLDAVADVTAVCLLIEELGPEKIVASPVHVGSGQVKCAHGILPVPAPATAYILMGVPTYGGRIRGELCTPTGAALLKHFVDEFGEMPVMKTEAIGYGMGKKDFAQANCVRAMLGQAEDDRDSILEISCNVDDMTSERIAFAMETLLEAGAKDVYTIPITMKKSRPGHLIRVMCGEADREKMLHLLFKHTTSIGVREQKMKRHILKREIQTLDTPYGDIRVKRSHGYGVSRMKLEYEDLAKAAKASGKSIAEIEDEISK